MSIPSNSRSVKVSCHWREVFPRRIEIAPESAGKLLLSASIIVSYYYSARNLILIYRPTEGERLSRPRCRRLCVVVAFAITQLATVGFDAWTSMTLQSCISPLDHCDSAYAAS